LDFTDGLAGRHERRVLFHRRGDTVAAFRHVSGAGSGAVVPPGHIDPSGVGGIAGEHAERLVTVGQQRAELLRGDVGQRRALVGDHREHDHARSGVRRFKRACGIRRGGHRNVRERDFGLGFLPRRGGRCFLLTTDDRGDTIQHAREEILRISGRADNQRADSLHGTVEGAPDGGRARNAGEGADPDGIGGVRIIVRCRGFVVGELERLAGQDVLGVNRQQGGLAERGRAGDFDGDIRKGRNGEGGGSKAEDECF